MSGQRLNHFPWLPVIKHMHDIAVTKRVRSFYGQFRMVLSVTAHSDSRRRGRLVIHPALYLPDIANICQRDQTDLIFGGRPRRARAFSDNTRTKGRSPPRSNDLRGQRWASPIRIPVPQAGKQHVVTLTGHIVEEGADFRCQKIGWGGTDGRCHTS